MPAVALRPNDLVRDVVSFTTQVRRLASGHHAQLGWYFTADTLGDDGLRFRRSDFTEGPPWAVEVQVTTDEDDREPAVYYDPHGVLRLLWQRDGSGTLTTTSTDGGSTWETPTTMITNGEYPAAAVHPQSGAEIVAAYVAGAIVGRSRYPGSTAFGSEFTFLNASSVALEVEPTGFGLSFALDPQASLLLHCVLAGEAETRTFKSTDLGATWAEVT